jgi:hypothetical protein
VQVSEEQISIGASRGTPGKVTGEAGAGCYRFEIDA